MLQKSKMGYFAMNANANPKKMSKNKKSLTKGGKAGVMRGSLNLRGTA